MEFVWRYLHLWNYYDVIAMCAIAVAEKGRKFSGVEVLLGLARLMLISYKEASTVRLDGIIWIS